MLALLQQFGGSSTSLVDPESQQCQPTATATKQFAENDIVHGVDDDSKKNKEYNKPPTVVADSMDVDEEAQGDAKQPKSATAAKDKDKENPSDEDDATKSPTSPTVIKHVAFSLLSAGVFKGDRSLKGVLGIGVQGIHDWVVKSDDCGALEKIVLCAFNLREASTLIQVCEEILGPAGNEEEEEKESGETSTFGGGAKTGIFPHRGSESVDDKPVNTMKNGRCKDKIVADNDTNTNPVEMISSRLSGVNGSGYAEGNNNHKEGCESDSPIVSKQEKEQTDINRGKSEKTETTVDSENDEKTESLVNAGKDIDRDSNSVKKGKEK